MKIKLASLFLLSILTHTARAQDTVSIDTTVHFQTIEGWGHGGGILGHTGGAYNMLDTALANAINYQTLDYLVDELGLTGTRTWEVGPRLDGTGMDNGDCDSIDWNKFQESLPQGFADYLVYFKNKIIANGFQPNIYSSPGYPTHATDQKPWIMFHPGERAQQIWASALYMKNTFGIDINYDVIYNEPSGNVNANVLADDIKALAPRLQLHGLSTRSQFPEAVAPLTAWNNFITPVINDSVLWPMVGRISYHNYGTADPYRSLISSFGLSKGISTAQTEMSNPSFDDLYSDLTLGNVSYWEVAYSSNNTLIPDSGLTSFTPSNTYFRLRQAIHYIRPGAVRVQAVTSDSLLHVLAFNRNGSVTVIIENISAVAQNVFVSGLPSGMYAMSKASPGTSFFQETGLRTVTGDTVTIPISSGSVVTTLYPYTGPNHAPAIMTYKTIPGYLVSPASAATLISSANDAEMDPHTFQWSVLSYPAGANPVIATPANATSSVSGLTEAGTYIFNIDVNDGTNTSSKKVYINVYSTNPPPVVGSCGFRIAAPYGLVFGNPGDSTHANIELPTSTVIVQAGASDLSSGNLSGQGTWSLIQQPAGANAIIDSTIYIYVSFRATVTNMIVPGDYIFQVNVTNPGHPDITRQIICTVHPASSPPVINSITPTPSVLTLPNSDVLLTAITSDPDADLLRHWWAIVSAPGGSSPQFDYQCKPVCNVSGLTIPGNYIFQLRAFDDLHMATQNITIQVNTANGLADESIKEDGIILYPNPVNDRLTVKFSHVQNLPSEVTIFDVLGMEWRDQMVPQNSREITVEMKSLPAGIYFIMVKTKEKSITGRFIKM